MASSRSWRLCLVAVCFMAGFVASLPADSSSQTMSSSSSVSASFSSSSVQQSASASVSTPDKKQLLKTTTTTTTGAPVVVQLDNKDQQPQPDYQPPAQEEEVQAEPEPEPKPEPEPEPEPKPIDSTDDTDLQNLQPNRETNRAEVQPVEETKGEVEESGNSIQQVAENRDQNGGSTMMVSTLAMMLSVVLARLLG